MAFNLTAGNPVAHRIRLYYTGSNTVYEGMPVCYEFDATTNWFGGSVSQSQGTAGEVTSTTTTAEGSQNEGKYIRVQDVDADNSGGFAGVVAKGSPGIGAAGPSYVDVFVPNGAIVPVRAYANCTVGITVLSISNGLQYLGVLGRPVAVAWETVDRSSTAGLVLAKLDANMFMYQAGDAQALAVDDQSATSTIILNQCVVTEPQTAGTFVPLYLHHTATGNTSAQFNPCNILAYMNLNGTYDVTVYGRAILAQTNLGGTFNGANVHVCGLMAQLTGAGTLTQVSKAACIMLDTTITGSGPTTGDLSFIRCANNDGQNANVKYFADIYGGYGIGNLFNLDNCANTGEDTSYMVFAGGTGSGALSTGGAWKKIRIVIDSTEYYLVALPAPTSA